MIAIRAFIGIDFDRDVKRGIYDLQQRIRSYAQKGRWKYVDNFHLTLKFLAEVNLTQKARIDDAMEKICLANTPLDLAVTGMGIFAGKDSIRVLWLGLTGDTEKINLLQQEINKQLAPIGFLPENRKFQPHITIGQDIIFECGFDQIRDTIGEVNFGMMKINGLFLFKSEQIQHKRVYSKVSKYDFSISS